MFFLLFKKESLLYGSNSNNTKTRFIRLGHKQNQPQFHDRLLGRIKTVLFGLGTH